MGEKYEMVDAEKEQLAKIENEDQQPPKKKRKRTSTNTKGKARKPLAPVQGVSCTYCDLIHTHTVRLYILHILYMHIHK